MNTGIGNRPAGWTPRREPGAGALASPTSPGLARQVVYRNPDRAAGWQLDRGGVGGFELAPPAQHTPDDATCPACLQERRLRR